MAVKNWWWGRSVSVDLHGCDLALITNQKMIARFVRQLAKLLHMKRVGPLEIKRFGHGQLRGYSMMQFIETSTIIAHFDEQGERAFIDVFSCMRYDPKLVGKFCKKFFKAHRLQSRSMERR